MAKVLIFGAGQTAKKIKNCLKIDCEVVAFIDNDPSKWEKEFLGVSILSPINAINSYQYQYIIIAVLNGYEKIMHQLVALGVTKESIITPFSFQHDYYNDWRCVFNIEELIYLEMNQKIENLYAHIENLEYEIVAKIRKDSIRYPKILSWEQAVNEIIQNKKSMSRYGDGEFDLMLGIQNSFQSVNEELSIRLREIVISNLKNHIVAIPNVYGDFEGRTEEFTLCFRNHFRNGARAREYAMLDMDKEYYDSFITRPYKDYLDKSNVGEKFQLIKTIWYNRDITIVEGEKTRLGVGNDLFAETKSCIRILCPAIEAFEKYEEILQTILETDKDRLVLIALGATATVLAYDLAKQGYQALDIGHIDIEYEWFLRGATEKIPIKGKYVNEASGGRIVELTLDNKKYYKEIVKVII